MMKRYCMVNELKPEHVKDYSDIHKNAHLTCWKTQLEALKAAGAENCIVYIYNNLSILLYECEDIEESFSRLGQIKDNNKWQATVAPWFAGTPKFDGTQKIVSLEKIFDLRQQLEGKLDPY